MPEETPPASQEEEIGLEAAGMEPMRDLKEAGSQSCHLNESEPSIRRAGMGEAPRIAETQ